MNKTDEIVLNELNQILNSKNILTESLKYREHINLKILELLSIYEEDWTDIQLDIIYKTLMISNSLYNNSDSDILLIEDGVYDTLIEKYRSRTKNFLFGAKPMDIKTNVNQTQEIPKKDMIYPMRLVSEEERQYKQNMLFPGIINKIPPYSRDDYLIEPMKIGKYITKRVRNTKHEHPELVGTLDKCKYVLDAQAKEKGVYNDSNVKILERDWLFPLLGTDIIPDQNYEFDMIVSLKYDGISVEADVTDEIISARTRGDTTDNEASDITPILGGYKFPHAIKLDKPIGMKFEAIMTYPNLSIFNQLRGKNYKNGRTAIIGLMGASDAYLYRDLITLIPLETDIKDIDGSKLDRLVEIEFMNKYYTKSEYFRFEVLSGNYVSMMFQLKRYVEEAEFARSYIPFMYDGVVVEFYKKEIREALGRVDSVNKYAMALKFNAMTKQTIFRGYEFTIGQNGVITPMIYYDPIEFFGTIHPKSTGNSYQRYRTLDLRIGDIIDVTYVNDVITRVTKPDNKHNRLNANKPKLPEEEFPKVCPSCGTAIEFSKDSARCPNIRCKARNIKRISAAISKLGVRDISEERIESLGYTTLRDLFSASVEELSIIGPNNAQWLYQQLDTIKKTPMEDYKVYGAIGFTNIATRTWQLIMSNITMKQITDEYKYEAQMIEVRDMILNIKGIGYKTANMITSEMPYFIDDIEYIMNNFNIIDTKGISLGMPKIRFTGFRDKDLEGKLRAMGYDVDGNAGVTKDTKILVTPYKGYNQGHKLQKALEYGVEVISIQDFKDKYLV